MSLKVQLSVLIVSSGVLLAGQSATAGDSGKFDFVHSISVTHQTAVEQLDHTVVGILGSGSMTIVKSSGGTFEAGSSANLTVVANINRSSDAMNLEAPMLAVDPVGDKLFMVLRRNTGTSDVGGGGEGRAEFTGGTGKYAGVTAHCSYTVDFLEGGHAIVQGHSCEWQKP